MGDIDELCAFLDVNANYGKLIYSCSEHHQYDDQFHDLIILLAP